MRRLTIPGWAALALSLLLSPALHSLAQAQNPPACLWQFEHYGVGEGTVSCTCGPPGDGLLNLDPLLDELEVEKPKYEGSIIQTAGATSGTWTYTPASNVCMSAIHAGLIPSQDEGGIVRFAATKGCANYEGGEQNDIVTYASGARGNSYYFPSLTDGGCPGEAGYGNKYEGPPAAEVLVAMAELLAPSRGLRYGAVESQGHEAFTVEAVTVIPEPGKSQPIRIGRLVIERIDMENFTRKLPPRYLTVRLEEVSLPLRDFEFPYALFFGGQRIKLNAQLDYYFNLRKGEFLLHNASIEFEDYGALRLRARLDGIVPKAMSEEGEGVVRPRWIRLWIDDEALGLAVLPALLGIAGDADVLAVAQGFLLPRLTAAAETAGLRQRALIARLAAWLREGSGGVQAFLQPAEPTSFTEIGSLFESDPDALVDRLRIALVYDGGPPLDLAAAMPSLEPLQPVYSESEHLILRYDGAGGTEDWIAIHYAGQPLDNYLIGSLDLQGQPAGEAEFGPIRRGIFEAVLWLDDGAGNKSVGAITWFSVQ